MEYKVNRLFNWQLSRYIVLLKGFLYQILRSRYVFESGLRYLNFALFMCNSRNKCLVHVVVQFFHRFFVLTYTFLLNKSSPALCEKLAAEAAALEAVSVSDVLG